MNHPKFRASTLDKGIWESVTVYNEYGLPDSITQPVVDIGAHIGAFAYACLLRGAPHVHCYEPDSENFELLRENLVQFRGRVTLHNKAVSSYTGRGALTCSDKSNTGCGNLTRGNKVSVVAVKHVHFPKDCIVKLDCEGSEFEIVPLLPFSKIQQIYGEYHLSPRRTVSDLLSKLSGFNCVSVPSQPDLGLFWASKSKLPVTFRYNHFKDTYGGYTRVAKAVVNALSPTLVDHFSPLVALAPADHQIHSVLRMTTWESTGIFSLAGVEQSAALIVPCEHNREMFERVGYKRPIHVLPQWGSGVFSHLPPARPFRFICIARDNGVPTRKGLSELISWFTEAFPSESDVALTVKQSPFCAERYTYDKRITFIRKDFNDLEYQNLLASHHCGIFLSGAEAWNFPAAELMATGRPSILIPFGGPADFTTPETSWHLPYKLIDAPKEVYRGVGKVAFPDKRGTIHAMREAYSDQLLLAEKALASAKASHEYTEARFAQRLRSIVNRYG